MNARVATGDVQPSALSPWQRDLARYGRGALLIQPSMWAVAVYRFGQHLPNLPRAARVIAHPVYGLAYSVVRLVTGIDIPRGARIGGGILIHHFGGIIIHPQAVIGEDCTMRHGVTIGARDVSGPPTLGDRVVLGAYAQILGSIQIGDDATIGAMSVVLSDVPRGCTVVGNPGRVIRGA